MNLLSGSRIAGSLFAGQFASGVTDHIVIRSAGVVFLDEGVIAAADSGTVLIDSSTIDVDTARAVHDAAAEHGFSMLDAPVSGGVVGADAATLTFMCGGDKTVFLKALPLLQGMGKNIVHCGGAGFGQVTKICNNMVAGITALAVAEAFVMGEKLGVQRQTLYDVLSTSTASSVILNKLCPMPEPEPGSASSNGFKPGFAAKLMLKDPRLSQSAAQMAGTATPLGAAATAAFAMHIRVAAHAAELGMLLRRMVVEP